MNPLRKFALVFIATFALAGATSAAWADGSVSFRSDVLPLVQQQPMATKFLLATFTVEDGGSGVRVADTAMPRLAGARMGPYRFDAIWHSPQGDVPVQLVIETAARFVDRKGREITNGNLRNAADFSETFEGLNVLERRQALRP